MPFSAMPKQSVNLTAGRDASCVLCADLVVLAARTEDDVSHLEVCVYEEATEQDEANLFVHHDLLLPGTASDHLVMPRAAF
jgi:hypothetical protein